MFLFIFIFEQAPLSNISPRTVLADNTYPAQWKLWSPQCLGVLVSHRSVKKEALNFNNKRGLSLSLHLSSLSLAASYIFSKYYDHTKAMNSLGGGSA